MNKQAVVANDVTHAFFDLGKSDNTALEGLLRLLKMLTRGDKWVLCIGYDCLLDKNLLVAAGIDLSKVRVVPANCNAEKQRYLEQASHHAHYAAYLFADNNGELSIPNCNTPCIKICNQRQIH
ncbi:hypothetical protein [Thaumasiovibrio sp. DFM-14]|uniref:hypothetical protein n=1 Tax=Thaumasiovibrio sp. DFM-14 TaxID=3384792 RepID=UPI0039A27015